jgi:hypothetical protein
MNINELISTENSSDYDNNPNKIMKLFKTDVFLTDRPSFTIEDTIEGTDSFHEQQMAIYSTYSDGSVI